jgi:hypothetical protein
MDGVQTCSHSGALSTTFILRHHARQAA